MATCNALLQSKGTEHLAAFGHALQLQRKCSSCGKVANGDCESCKRRKVQRRIAVGHESSRWEAEADRAAAAVTSVPRTTLARPVITPLTEDGGARNDMAIPESVERVIASPGAALDAATRHQMEHGFGADFSQVRVHNDALAAQSSHELGARAYTLGAHVVFGQGQYGPGSSDGRQLIAHELAHTLQQGGATAHLQRACLPAKDCAAPATTLENFVKDTEKKPENISKSDKRKKACTKVPPDPGCTNDGHGAQATALTAIVQANYPSRLSYVTGIYVDKDMPADWAAVTFNCSDFTPPKAGSQCTFVPDVLEAQGKLYQGGAKSLAGQSRQDWLTATIGTLTHETEHARYDTAAPIPEPNATACKFSDHESNLSEMAAHFSEMHVFYRAALTRSGPDRFKEFNDRFDFWVNNGAEDISGIVKDLRCKCECADADYYIKKTVESVDTSQKWDSNERFMIHTALSDPKWALKWPIAPGAVNINDLPTAAATPFKLE
jgi:hypothetical protein